MNFLRNLLQSKDIDEDLSSLHTKDLQSLEAEGNPDSYQFCTSYTEENCRADQSILNPDSYTSEKGCFGGACQEFFAPDKVDCISQGFTKTVETDKDSCKLLNEPYNHSHPDSFVATDPSSFAIKESDILFGASQTPSQEVLSAIKAEDTPLKPISSPYDFDLSDPNFNPFQTRCAIRNSPDKVLNQDSPYAASTKENHCVSSSSPPTESNLDIAQNPSSSNSLKPPKSTKNSLAKPKFLSKKSKRNRHKANNTPKEEPNNFFVDIHIDEKSLTEKEIENSPALKTDSVRNSSSSEDQPFVTPEVSPLISRESSPKKEATTELELSNNQPEQPPKESSPPVPECHGDELQILNEIKESDNKPLEIVSLAKSEENSAIEEEKADSREEVPPVKEVAQSIESNSEKETNLATSGSESIPLTKATESITHSVSELSLLANEDFEQTLGSEANRLAEELNLSSSHSEKDQSMESTPSSANSSSSAIGSRRSLKIEGKSPSEDSKSKNLNMNQSEAGPEIATGITSSDLQCASKFLKKNSNIDDHIGRTLVTALGSHCKLVDDLGVSSAEADKSDSLDFSEQCHSTPPPREERSAPEGTSSPDPRSLEGSEIKSSNSSAPLRSEEVNELLKKQELQYEEKLLRQGIEAAEKEKQLRETMKEERKELVEVKTALEEVTSSRDVLLKLVEQYKGMLASLVSEKEKLQQGQESSTKVIEAEKRQALEDLANVEAAFSDVHRKYERTKQIVDALRRNEETLRTAVGDYESKLQVQEKKYAELQKHAEEKVKQANEEFESLRRANDQEMTKMAALLKKAEMKIISLQESLDRKSRENQELTQLCDDLISKVGS